MVMVMVQHVRVVIVMIMIVIVLVVVVVVVVIPPRKVTNDLVKNTLENTRRLASPSFPWLVRDEVVQQTIGVVSAAGDAPHGVSRAVGEERVVGSFE